MAEWRLHTLHAMSYGTGPDNAPWRAMFRRSENGEEQEIGLLHSEIVAEVQRLEAGGFAVPASFREAIAMIESSSRPLD